MKCAHENISIPNIKTNKMARQKGMITMLEDGVRKAELGMTTMEEVLRVAET